jgi:hypothetical protein
VVACCNSETGFIMDVKVRALVMTLLFKSGSPIASNLASIVKVLCCYGQKRTLVEAVDLLPVSWHEIIEHRLKKAFLRNLVHLSVAALSLKT